MTVIRRISNASIIIIEYMTLRDDMLAAKNNKLLNLEIEGDQKIVINYYNNNKNIIPNFIMLLMEDIWKLSQNLYIYGCCHIYRETNRITYCLANKGIYNLDSIIWWSNFPYDVRKFNFEYYYDTFFNCICRCSISQLYIYK